MPSLNYFAMGSLGGIQPYTILATILDLKKQRQVLEFGTYRGVGILTIALNTPKDTEIVKVDLLAKPAGDDITTLSRGVKEWAALARDTVGIAFRNHPLATKIRQIRENSPTFEARKAVDKIDFGFVDGGHSYECIKYDTENCLSVLSDKGVIVWDDYGWYLDPVCSYLRELLRKLPHKRIAGTRMVIYAAGRS